MIGDVVGCGIETKDDDLQYVYFIKNGNRVRNSSSVSLQEMPVFMVLVSLILAIFIQRFIPFTMLVKTCMSMEDLEFKIRESYDWK